jgi:7-carboxy-7-deazaguanine synthase
MTDANNPTDATTPAMHARAGEPASHGDSADVLSVCEIFLSLQGEASRMGLPCAFVRLAGCNLRCQWCDTSYAREGGQDMTVKDVMARVSKFNCRRVELTGGEPLCQPAALELMAALCDAGWEVLLETNGSRDIGPVDSRVARIVDFKCPSSGMSHENLWSNVERLCARDEVKFVLADRGDYNFAAAAVRGRGLLDRCPIIFSPVHGRLAPADLAEWILTDGLDIRLGLQLHKLLWPDEPRGR